EIQVEHQGVVGRRRAIGPQDTERILVAEDGAPRLRVRASFRIRLEDPFGILGPDGPSPANDTLVFYLDFLMEAESGAEA
ncbi:MAG: hypothetical protein AAGD06_26285, partial [Acidobacteriota bacterium]